MTGSNEPCRRLEWDSTFFGVPIARVDPPVLDESGASRALDWCRRERIRCLYYLCPLDPAAMRVAEAHGFQAMDARVTLTRPGDLPTPSMDASVRDYQEDDREPLREIARAAFRGTRFDADPHFAAGRAHDLYDVWLTRSCEGWARRVLVATTGAGPIGFVTCHDDSEAAWRIGLIGVAESARGRGAGGALVRSAIATSAASGARVLSVVTQGANIQAQRLYQGAGFLTSAVDLWYHRWFEATST